MAKQVLRLLTIKQMLLLSHLVLVFALVTSLSLSRYLSEWHSRLAQASEHALSAANPIIDLVSPAAAGLNYTNVKLDAAMELYQQTPRLVYFHAHAYSDFSSQPFGFAYERDSERAWQTNLSQQDLEAQQLHVKLLKHRLSSGEGDPVKYGFLLQRAIERLQRIRDDIHQTKHADFLLTIPGDAKRAYLLDEPNRLMIFSLPLRNANQGELVIAFDISRLLEARQAIQRQVLVEGGIALLFSSLLIWGVTYWLVSPLRALAGAMSKNVRDVDAEKIPGLERTDEIGVLSKRFSQLIQEANLQLDDLEEKSSIDHLTRLGSRLKFASVSSSYIGQAQRAGQCLGFLICDLDYFKRYNDSMGHPKGDEVLRKTAATIEVTLKRESDMAFRLGGEEFVVLLQTTEPGQVHDIAMSIVENVAEQNILHPNHPSSSRVTLSVGSLAVSHSLLGKVESVEQLYQSADEALYLAKEAGRNCIKAVNWNSVAQLPQGKGNAAN